jgi:hypothetical protein
MRSWPTAEMLLLLETGTAEQLHNALAYLPKADTEGQEAFLIALAGRIKELENAA